MGDYDAVQLAIPIGQYYEYQLEQFYDGLGYTFGLQGCSNDSSPPPVLPAGLTFNNRTSELYGTVSNPTASNSGIFCLTTYIGEGDVLIPMNYCYYNIYYTS